MRISFPIYLVLVSASLFAAIIRFGAPIVAAADAPVRLDTGLVSGVPTDLQVRVFKGIPFAAPPVGPLRWRPPQPSTHWEGVRTAERFSPSCQQPPRTRIGALLLTSQRLGESSEDCLYLNVWTVAATRNGLPVMVWFPGGGFATGGGSALVFDGEALANRGIVPVTVNYRLGAFGFFAHPELTRESNGQPSGNYGLLDQIAALRWVQRNIAAFGGDPTRVTIFGQSAGATSVFYLMASPLAKGLFQRAIGESGGGTGGILALDPTIRQQDAEQLGVRLAQALSAKSLAELRAAPATEVQRAAQVTGPFIDGRVVPELPELMFRNGQQRDVPLLVGSNADDGFAQRRNFYETYIKSYPDGTEQQANVDAMAWRVWTWADLHTKAGNKAYLYYFTRRAPTDAPVNGAYHGAELPYVFRNLRLFNQQWDEVDRRLEEVISSYWVNFAVSGDPNGRDLPRWSAYQPSQRNRLMKFGETAAHGESRLDNSKISMFDGYHATLTSR